MRPYASLLRVRFINGLQYRAAAIGGASTQAFWGVMLVFIYRAFYAGQASANGFAYVDFVSYTWLQQSFLAFCFLYDWDGELLEMITSGGIGYELTRPVVLYRMWYAKLISKRLSMAALRAGPVLLIALCLPYPYGLHPPAGPASLALFALSLGLGLMLLVSIVMLIYLSIFKTMSAVGSIGVLSIVGEFFGGGTIPIPFMPDALQRVCYFMPFRWTNDFPFRVYSGSVPVPEALAGVAIQAAWILALFAFGEFAMRRVSRLAAIQGG